MCGRRVGGGQAGHYQHVRSAFHLTWQLWNSGNFKTWQQAKSKGQEMSEALWKSKDANDDNDAAKKKANKRQKKAKDTPAPPPRAQVDRLDDKGPDPDGDSGSGEALLCKMWLATVRALTK